MAAGRALSRSGPILGPNDVDGGGCEQSCGLEAPEVVYVEQGEVWFGVAGLGLAGPGMVWHGRGCGIPRNPSFKWVV